MSAGESGSDLQKKGQVTETTTGSKKEERVIGKRYGVNLGRYEGDQPSSPPTNRVFIGREKERNYFIEHLKTMAAKGGVLITGYRGAGKTAFINHCLDNYKNDIYTRFLRANTGKTFLWDKVGLFFVSLVLIITFVLLSELLEIAFLTSSDKGTFPANWKGWVACAPLLLLSFFPFYYGIQLIKIGLHRQKTELAYCVIGLSPFLIHKVLHPSNPIDDLLKLLVGLVIALALAYRKWRLQIFCCSDMRDYLKYFSVMGILALVAAIIIGLFFLKNKWMDPILLFISFIFLLTTISFSKKWFSKQGQSHSDKDKDFLHYISPHTVITIKGIVFLVLGTLIVYPFISYLSIPYFPKPLSYTDISQKFQAIFIVLLIFLIIAFMEYEWVIKEIQRKKSSYGSSSPLEKENWNLLLESTFFRKIFKIWLPVLVIKINLGFDRLEHKRVIEAMLKGLRYEFHSAFLSWKSRFFLFNKLIFTFLILVSLNVIDKYLLMEPMSHFAKITPKTFSNTEGTYNIFNVLNFDILTIYDPEKEIRTRIHEEMLLHYLLPAGPHGTQNVFKVYQILLFLFLYGFVKLCLIYRPILPYMPIHRRIGKLLDYLLSSVKEEVPGVEVSGGLGFLKLKRNSFTKKIETSPLDPRTIEMDFEAILNAIQNISVQLPGSTNHRISLPVPEITFLFDELDKIGTRFSPTEGTRGDAVEESENFNEERVRSLEIHRLFADMKNLLSSSPARFIFIGGRGLHDEWHGDQSSRWPLLTSIFTGEIYLPSLLTDHTRPEEAQFESNIKKYLCAQFERGNELNRRWEAQRTALCFFLLGPNLLHKPNFIWSEEMAPLSNYFKVYDMENPASGAVTCSEDLETEFVQFLTFRSMGNPKRLKELLESFIIPNSPIYVDPEAFNRAPFNCCHLLYFEESDIFRIQIVSELFRNLKLNFEDCLAKWDDKLSSSIFYLSDFLCKFHRRAFTRSSLELMDEIVHIHKAPNLRTFIEKLVFSWSEYYLQPIRNGMYDYRFRSSFTRELNFVSIISEQEMAAINFTLDESQSLKSLYRAQIRSCNEEWVFEFEIGLGELHEFDEEYDLARYYYQKAMESIDTVYPGFVGEVKKRSDTSKNEKSSALKGEQFITGGINRLRLMLRTGLTFEKSKNYERALIEYRDARLFSNKLIRNFLEYFNLQVSTVTTTLEDSIMPPVKDINLLFQPLFAQAWVAEKMETGVDTGPTEIEVQLDWFRKHLPFVNENEEILPSNRRLIAHSHFSLIMAELHNKAGNMYFYKGKQKLEVDRIDFYKEKESDPPKIWEFKERIPYEGYLLSAYYHYALSLHEIRRYITYRLKSSTDKINRLVKNKEGPEEQNGKGETPTFQKGQWPDFVYQTAAGSISDLAETMFSRVSLIEIMKSLTLSGQAASIEGSGKCCFKGTGINSCKRETEDREDCEFLKTVKKHWKMQKWWAIKKPTPKCEEIVGIYDLTQKWLELSRSGKVEQVPLVFINKYFRMPIGIFSDWLGVWNEDAEKHSNYNWSKFQIEFNTFSQDPQRLIMSIIFSIVSSEFRKAAGYQVYGAFGQLLVAETIEEVLWARLGIRTAINKYEKIKSVNGVREEKITGGHHINQWSKKLSALIDEEEKKS